MVLQGGAAWAAVDPVAQLRSPDIGVRRRAIDQIQTLEDPRLPEACLPLLQDEGLSIRRQAARAIGSRFAQIPGARVDAFVAALRRCAKEGPEDVTFIAERAIGLLTRKFTSPAFSRSPDGRWVLYEQRRLPVVADRQLQSPQLLSPTHPDPEMISSDSFVALGNIEDLNQKTKLLKLMVTNDSMERLFHPHWQPQSKALALSPDIQRRFYEPIILWRARDGAVTTWSVRSFRALYGQRFPHWGTLCEFVKWRGTKALIHIYDVDDAGGGEPFDPKGIIVSVDVETWKIALE
jgi:hypothetical protein